MGGERRERRGDRFGTYLDLRIWCNHVLLGCATFFCNSFGLVTMRECKKREGQRGRKGEGRGGDTGIRERGIRSVGLFSLRGSFLLTWLCPSSWFLWFYWCFCRTWTCTSRFFGSCVLIISLLVRFVLWPFQQFFYSNIVSELVVTLSSLPPPFYLLPSSRPPSPPSPPSPPLPPETYLFVSAALKEYSSRAGDDDVIWTRPNTSFTWMVLSLSSRVYFVPPYQSR